MRRLSFRTVLIAIAGGFFLLGIISTVLRPSTATTPSATPTPTTAAAAPSPPAETPQTTILVLGIDSFGGQPPTLLASWIVSFRPPGKDVFLFGLPVDWPMPDGVTLEEVFQQTGGEGEAFDVAIAALTPLPLDAVVVLDSEGFSAVIDFLGGVPSGGETVGGAAALNILDLLRADPKASLQAQYRLLEALSAQAGVVEPGIDLQPLVDLLPAHASLSVSPQEAIRRIAPLLPLDPERIHISLPDADENG